mmetsp:Transcript_49977/g.117496  ORF Transcript_49977/g.117496 Transcript_49977/m.117496 type:complete len:230 (+) Transcript_49977:324-1013(+)
MAVTVSGDTSGSKSRRTTTPFLSNALRLEEVAAAPASEAQTKSSKSSPAVGVAAPLLGAGCGIIGAISISPGPDESSCSKRGVETPTTAGGGRRGEGRTGGGCSTAGGAGPPPIDTTSCDCLRGSVRSRPARSGSRSSKGWKRSSLATRWSCWFRRRFLKKTYAAIPSTTLRATATPATYLTHDFSHALSPPQTPQLSLTLLSTVKFRLKNSVDPPTNRTSYLPALLGI